MAFSIKSVPTLIWILFTLFILIFSVYAYSAARTNPGYADSDELITAAYTLGSAHPPGYPLMIVLTRLFTVLPIPGTFAFRANLFAGFLQALTVVGIAWLSYRILTSLEPVKSGPKPKSKTQPESFSVFSNRTLNPIVLTVAVTTALLVGLSAIFWLYASVLEVFSLNNLLVVAGLVTAWEWRLALLTDPKRAWRWFFATAVITGVGISHVQSYIFMVPAFGIFLLLTLFEKRQWSQYLPKQLIWLIGGMVIGAALPSLLLFWLNSHQSDYSWSFAQSWSGWWRMLLRQDYHGFIPDKEVTANAYNIQVNLPGYFQTLPGYLEFLNSHFAYLGLGLGLVGLTYLYWLQRRLFWLIIPIILFGGLWFSLYLGLPNPAQRNLEYRSFIGVTHRQYLQGEVLWSLPLLFGLWAIASYLKSLLKKQRLVLVGIVSLGLLLVGWSFWSNREVGIQRDNQFAWRYSRSLLDQAEPGGVILCSADLPCFSLFYQQVVEKYRPEVTVLAQNNHISEYKLNREPQFKGFSYSDNPFFFADLISWNVANRPTYLTDATSYYIEYLGLEGNPFFLVPRGMLFQVVTAVPKDFPVYDSPISEYLLALPKPSQNYWLNGIQDYLASVHNIHGLIYSHVGLKDAARYHFDTALKLKPDYADPKSLRDSLVGYMGNPNYQPGTVSSSSAQLIGAAAQQIKAKRLQEAYRIVQKATFLEPKNPKPRLELAELYKIGGYVTEAKLEYENVLKYNPENEAAKEGLKKIGN